MNKKALFIGGTVGTGIIVVILVFLMRGSAANTTTNDSESSTTTSFLPDNTPTTTTSTSEFPQLSLPEISRISQEKALPGSLTLSTDGEKLLFFQPEKGDFYSIKLDGSQLAKISEKNFYGVSEVRWSPTKDRAALFFKKTDAGEARGIYIYDLISKTVDKLSPRISQVTFSPDGKKIAYWYIDNENKVYNLSAADYNGHNFSVLSSQYVQNGLIYWHPKTGNIYFWDKPVDALLSSVYEYSFSTKDARAIYTGKMATVPCFSSTGGYIFFTFLTGNQTAPVSGTISSSGGQTILAPGLATIASKGVWSEDEASLYVGVPASVTNLSMTDYFAGKAYTQDDVWVYDLATDKKAMLLRPSAYGESVDIREPLLSLDEKLMFFINGVNQNVYAVNLEKARDSAEYLPGTNPDGTTATNPDLPASAGSGSATVDNSLSPEERLFRKLR